MIGHLTAGILLTLSLLFMLACLVGIGLSSKARR